MPCQQSSSSKWEESQRCPCFRPSKPVLGQDLAPESLFRHYPSHRQSGHRAGRTAAEEPEVRHVLGSTKSCPATWQPSWVCATLPFRSPFHGQPGSLLLNHKSTSIYFHFFFYFEFNVSHAHVFFLKNCHMEGLRMTRPAPRLSCSLPQVLTVQGHTLHRVSIDYIYISQHYILVLQFLDLSLLTVCHDRRGFSSLIQVPSLSLFSPTSTSSISICILIGSLHFVASKPGASSGAYPWVPTHTNWRTSRHGESPRVKGRAMITPPGPAPPVCFFHPHALWTCSSPWLLPSSNQGSPTVSPPHMPFRVHSPPLCLIYRHFPTTLHLAEILDISSLIIPTLFFSSVISFHIFLIHCSYPNEE